MSECSHPCCGETCRKKKEPKARTPIKRTALKRYSAKPKQKNDELEAFFYNCACIIAEHPRCSECDSFITPNLYRFATAHIFPKKLFPSIAAHPLNWLKLNTPCGCHDRSHRLDTFSEMYCFRFATERFIQFEHEIKENNKYLHLFKEYAIKKGFYAK